MTGFALDPEFDAAAGGLMRALGRSAPLAVGDWATRRELVTALMRRLDRKLPERAGVRREPWPVRAADGTELGAVWYRPAPTTATSASGGGAGPAVLFLHGGGMILGAVDDVDREIALYAELSGVPVLAVDYRLAPENPDPLPLEDCYAALVAMADSAVELGIDPGRIGVLGESAGGGLAAGVTLLARERGGPSIARQVLIYPMLDDRTTGPDEHLGRHAVWTYDDNATGWGALLGERVGGAAVAPASAPGRCVDMTDLPPAYIEVGEIDVFRDEAIAYASRLLGAGVSCELRVVSGVPHTYEWIAPDVTAARRSIEERVRYLRRL
ncbi:MAG: alpha/beta hydrolase [Gordonia sp. (in: high G+C Gram-positive bacteria)]|uniref:alpha/beta hydrolase n=1 Tax=Gordonia sp. (in: high G+C Gram-positive bacteria) TaxID=84139 RepID=UPI0039E4941F